MSFNRYEYYLLPDIRLEVSNDMRSSHTSISPNDSFIRVFNRLGQDGWECCGIGDNKALFKRVVDDYNIPKDNKEEKVVYGFVAKGPLFENK
ncbi:MAG: hypothetical protein AABY32_05100 [Nanoarchaeota archaeon]